MLTKIIGYNIKLSFEKKAKLIIKVPIRINMKASVCTFLVSTWIERSLRSKNIWQSSTDSSKWMQSKHTFQPCDKVQLAHIKCLRRGTWKSTQKYSTCMNHTTSNDKNFLDNENPEGLFLSRETYWLFIPTCLKLFLNRFYLPSLQFIERNTGSAEMKWVNIGLEAKTIKGQVQKVFEVLIHYLQQLLIQIFQNCFR